MKLKSIFACVFSFVFLAVFSQSIFAEDVRVSGSSSVSPLLIKLAAEFEKQNTKHSIIVETSDSTVGIQDTINKKNNIGMSSRDLKNEEMKDLKKILLCNDGLAIIVNKDALLKEVTKKELTDLYMNNKAIGAISKAVSREDGSGTREAFASLTGIAKSSPLPRTVEILDGTGKVMVSVAADTKKLGYISLGSLNNTVKALAYNDGTQKDYVMPSAANIKNGSYKLYRPFYLVVRKDAKLSAGTKAFLDFCSSAEAQKIISSSGYVVK